MSTDRTLLGNSERFTEIVEARIEAKVGEFAEPHPFLRTAVRGLAGRLNKEFVPMGFVMATELYLTDIHSGTDGFTGEPMPTAVTGMPMADAIIRITAIDLAREAFGNEFGDAVDETYKAIRKLQD